MQSIIKYLSHIPFTISHTSKNQVKKIILEKGDRFLNKCFTLNEIKNSENHKDKDRYYAFFSKRFAAKEACLKALGTGMREGLSWQDMEISNDDLGRPVMIVSGGVLKRLNDLSPEGLNQYVHITLSDEAGLAKATVILEGI